MKMMGDIAHKTENLSSVSNAIKLLKSFTIDQPVKYVSELARELNVSKSTVSRLVKTLVEEEFLVKDTESQGYKLGYGVLTLGGLLVSNNELYKEVGPVLSDVVIETGESAHLAKLEGSRVIYISKREGPYFSDILTQIGRYNPAHATSSGKVLLAYEDASFVDQLFNEGVETFTEHTIVNPIQFKKELKKIREQGYALSISELTEGNFSMASPVYNYEGQVVSSIAIIGPLSRFNKTKVQQYRKVLFKASKEASERLGYDAY